MSENIIETNDHASRCKLIAVNLGYYEDLYLHNMISKGSDRMSPEVNRGYALRVLFLRNFIHNFSKFFMNNCQIISLGCGFDTLYWDLEKSDCLPKYGFFELDFDLVILHKFKLIT
ncbi:hypothetical protein HZS_362 [Henneguya salminicola]|nr:hypothetical protein HZS_362 [Henneguya salminicola]